MTKRKDLTIRQNPGSRLSRMFDFGRFHDMIDNWEEAFWNDVAPWGWWTADVFKQIQPGSSKTSFPKVNVLDKEDSYLVEIAVAGFEKDDVSLELKDNCLFISAEKEEEVEDEKGSYVMKEIASRSFRRVVRLPKEVDQRKIECNYKDGVVKCFIGKKGVDKQEEKPLKIEIS
jgi:HSP20 family protein